MTDKMSGVKMGIWFISSSLVDCFISAATCGLINNSSTSKLKRVGAKIGGFLVGTYIGDKISDYVLETVEGIFGEIQTIQQLPKGDDAT